MTGSAEHAVSRGRAWPMGVTLDETIVNTAGVNEAGVNVAIWAPEATQIFFCLFDEADSEEQISLPFSEGGIWHAHISGVAAGARYGLRAAGPHQPDAGLRFNPAKLLIDPYARAIEAPLVWHPLMAAETATTDDETQIDSRDSAPVVPKCLVTHTDSATSRTAGPALAHARGTDHDPAPSPDPTSNRPRHELADLVIYEAHVKGLTATHPDVPEEIRGTYAGMAHPAVLTHLVSLGINAVELLPVQAFFDDKHLVDKGLTNYWGYQPIAWLAPEPRYARSNADTELRQLVYALHDVGIEVIVDVVFNHTGEGDEYGPTLAHRGLHNTGYYRLGDTSGSTYVNDTGTGNTVAAEQPMVLRLILDSLRHWVERYGIDGFRFDLASTLGRNEHGFDVEAAFFQAVQQDPVLAGIKLIAEPWDLGPGGYQLGRFPSAWSEWNDHFRDGVRRVWRGDTIGDAHLGSLLLGSAKHFDHAGRGATASVNFVTAHDGFTLADVVSYAHKHNEANGEGGRDGHDNNLSDNLGVEGPSNDEEIVAARQRRVRAMLATLLVSQGVPMLLAGDEIGNSQAGNNNAYAQDGPIGWLDWSSLDTELLGVVQRLVDIRRRHPVLRQRTFLHGRVREDHQRDVVWYRPDGVEPTEADWSDPAGRCVVVLLRGAAGDVEGEALADAVLLILNTGHDLEVRVPEAGGGRAWQVEIDTARPEGEDHVDAHYFAFAQSVVVLSAVPPA